MIQDKAHKKLHDLSEDMLPVAVVEISTVIGMPATIKLILNFGGVDLDVPVGTCDSAKKDLLINKLGYEAAQKLMSVYGNSKLYINKCDAALRQLRRSSFLCALQDEITKGTTQKQAIQKLAPMYDITERWAYQIIKDDRSQTDLQSTQLGLF